jgi:deferrochelatase/peroxidase EfeB
LSSDSFAEAAEQAPNSQSESSGTLSRRALLGGAAAGAGLAVGVGATLLGTGGTDKAVSITTANSGSTVPFYGYHQAGIATTPPSSILFAAYDVTTSQVSELAELLRTWTTAAGQLCSGQIVDSDDSGETIGLPPSSLTLTFGFGPGIFDERFGLAARAPENFGPLPAFNGQQLDLASSGGDLMVQACAEDQMTAFHAVRQLDRLAVGTANERWGLAGFGASAEVHNRETPRNLLGFKDGTANPKPGTKAFDSTVWLGERDSPDWMRGGTYLCVRRIRTNLFAWDDLTPADQEVVIGREKLSGAPLSGGNEFSPLNFATVGPDGVPAIPLDSHVRLASDTFDGGATMLRRGYSYDNGGDTMNGIRDSGMLFLAYVRDIEAQFVPIQRQLADSDRMNPFVTHIGTATFAVPPGVGHGTWIGQSLFA